MSTGAGSVGIDLESLDEICREWRANGDRLITTNGCFDILHAGHIYTLQAARELGDRLIVGLNSDESVRRLKGDDRPIVPEDQRAATLASLPFVDWVQIFSEPVPDRVLETVRPAIHVKGGDYQAERLPEYGLIRSLGGEVVVLPEIEGVHTSTLLDDYAARRRGPR